MSFALAFDELAIGSQQESFGRTLTEADIAAFAALTGDMHPQHVDAEWAAASLFGRRIAHGLLVLSYAVGLAPFEPDRVLALRAVREAVFKRPVGIGDTIRLRSAIARLRPVGPDAGLVGCRLDVVNQRSEVCVRAELDLLWRRDAARA